MTDLMALTPRKRTVMSGRKLTDPPPPRVAEMIENANQAIAAGFKGVTTDGNVMPGLFPIAKTGVSTEALRNAATAFLASLDPEQRAAATFPIESDVWQRWSNVHMYSMRHGAWMETMTERQREAVFDLMRASLSAAGFVEARDIMRLNETIREMTGSDEEYGEWLYWVSILGEPSGTEPWGWQIDGHHLIINCFVLGDQVVMTPMFMGSEPCIAYSGKYAGTRVFAAEESAGETLMRALQDGQRARAVISDQMPREVFAGAFRDNFEQRYEGLPAGDMTSDQQTLLWNVIESFVGRIADGHAKVKLQEVERHLDETYFGWIGSWAEGGAFYYRVHSPVILIEFDHQRGVAFDNDEPSRQHIHTVVRTPNGNDYGKDLLRQHYERHRH